MMFLLKCAFWLGLVFFLAPVLFPDSATPPARPVAAVTAPATPVAPAPPAAATTALTQAGRVLGFCSENPGLCATAAGIAASLGDLAGSSIDFLTGLVSDRPSSAARLRHDAAAGDPTLSGTLTASDREEPWHGVAPAPRQPQG